MGKDQQPASVAPTIYNVTLTTASTEYSQVLHDGDGTTPGIKKIQVKCRTIDDISYSFVSSGDYVTIPGGQTYSVDGLDARGLTIYLIGGVNGLVAEVEVWL